MEDKDKGKLVALEEVNSYTECESLCDNNQDCMNFEHCPTLKTCRIFDKKIRGVEYLKQVKWYDCYGNYATCKKGTRTSMNITNNSIFIPTLFTISVNFDILIFFQALLLTKFKGKS